MLRWWRRLRLTWCYRALVLSVLYRECVSLKERESFTGGGGRGHLHRRAWNVKISLTRELFSGLKMWSWKSILRSNIIYTLNKWNWCNSTVFFCILCALRMIKNYPWPRLPCSGGQVHSFLIMNLAFSDCLMGIYLLLIAVVDQYYRGRYSVHEFSWRSSQLCHLAGFISTFSSELSVFTLTGERLHANRWASSPWQVSVFTLTGERLHADRWASSRWQVSVFTLTGERLHADRWASSRWQVSVFTLTGERLHAYRLASSRWQVNVFTLTGELIPTEKRIWNPSQQRVVLVSWATCFEAECHRLTVEVSCYRLHLFAMRIGISSIEFDIKPLI